MYLWAAFALRVPNGSFKALWASLIPDPRPLMQDLLVIARHVNRF